MEAIEYSDFLRQECYFSFWEQATFDKEELCKICLSFLVFLGWLPSAESAKPSKVSIDFPFSS